MFGGQSLIPYGNQVQYDDMWILSIPSFTWIPVDTDKQSVPYARAGHICNVWDGQMIVAGGYIGKDISCETPGIYVFNMSSLQWQNQYSSLNSAKGNPFSQQTSQKGIDAKAGLDGSYGYQVPVAVQAVVGGHGNGGATITAPVQTATSGPLASGKPITYTVTGANGAVITGTTSSNNGGSNSNGKSGPNVAAIAAGVVAGLLAILATYLAFCALIYRKQLQIYKQYSAMSAEQREQMSGGGPLFGPPAFGSDTSSANKHNSNGQSSLIGPYHQRTAESIDTSYAGRTSGQTSGSATASSEDLMEGFEPSFYGVLLHPRRSLRVVNRD